MLFVWPYLHLALQNNLAPRSLDEVRQWSASPTDFLTPSIQHFAWGDWVKGHFDRNVWVEQNIYVGIVTLVLAGYALLSRRSSLHRFVVLLALVGLVSFILSLGTDLHWLGQTVRIPTPAFLQPWHPQPQTAIPLPGYLFFKFLPYYSIMRVWMRYAIFVQLFASLLAGIGLALLGQSVSKASKQRLPGLLLSSAALILIILDFLPANLPFSEIAARPVDAWLAQQPGQGAVAQFPFEQNIQPQQTYYTLIHNKPFIGGFFAAAATEQYRRIQPVLEDFPSAARAGSRVDYR
jgi:hypothetical protein